MRAYSQGFALMIKWFFISLILTFQSTFAVGPEECPSFDFSERFGPVRSQGAHGLCWAFTASALLEEQECLRNPFFCGKHLSPIDASRCDWVFGTKNEGSSIQGAIQCALDQGVCKEIDAPFFERFSAACLARIFVNGNPASLEQCQTEDIMAFYRQWKNRITEKEVCDYHNSPLEKNEDFSKIIAFLSEFKTITTELSNETFQASIDPLKTLLSSQDERDFLKQVLIPNACKENRLQFKGNLRSPIPLDVEWVAKNPKENAKYQYGNVLNAFRQNRSVGLSFCTTMTQEKNLIEKIFITDKNPECEAHAIVANGMRWNKEKNRCELHLRNSWGPLAPYQGWSDMDKILQATYGTTFIE